jgi:hypothetical protein
MNNTVLAYELCGLPILSEFPLPELVERDGWEPSDAVEIRMGDVPTNLADAAFRNDWVQVNAAGDRALLHIPGVASYAIESGRRITVAPQMRHDAPDIRLFLLGDAFGYLCHQRGLLPIHAAAVEIDGGVVLLSGESGAGKSTLASAFWRAGHRVLTDDLALLDMSQEYGALVRPGISRIRLWPDSARHAELEIGVLERCREALAKVSVPLENAQPSSGLPVRALFHLRRTDDGTAVRLKPLKGLNAVRALRGGVYRVKALDAVRGRALSTLLLTQAASRIPEHFRLDRQVDYGNLAATMAAIISALR